MGRSGGDGGRGGNGGPGRKPGLVILSKEDLGDGQAETEVMVDKEVTVG